jgi:hypothetical protein
MISSWSSCHDKNPFRINFGVLSLIGLTNFFRPPLFPGWPILFKFQPWLKMPFMTKLEVNRYLKRVDAAQAARRPDSL